MKISELKKIRKKLPPQYGKDIAELMNNPAIDNKIVARVFHGEITDMAIVTPVVDAALGLIRTRQALQKKIDKVLNPS